MRNRVMWGEHDWAMFYVPEAAGCMRISLMEVPPTSEALMTAGTTSSAMQTLTAYRLTMHSKRILNLRSGFGEMTRMTISRAKRNMKTTVYGVMICYIVIRKLISIVSNKPYQ